MFLEAFIAHKRTPFSEKNVSCNIYFILLRMCGRHFGGSHGVILVEWTQCSEYYASVGWTVEKAFDLLLVDCRKQGWIDSSWVWLSEWAFVCLLCSWQCSIARRHVWLSELFPFKVHAGCNDWPGELTVIIGSKSLYCKYCTGRKWSSCVWQ